jgi:hypothetical protein
MTPKNKMSATKKVFTVNLITSYTKHVGFYLLLAVSVPLSLFTVSVFIFLTLIPNIPFLFTAIPQRRIISLIHSIGYTALLKTLQSLQVIRAAMPL